MHKLRSHKPVLRGRLGTFDAVTGNESLCMTSWFVFQFLLVTGSLEAQINWSVGRRNRLIES